MRMLHERTEHILAAAIREFIRSGEPVSSGQLYEGYNFGIKPAMIRLILKDLDDSGYLEQPNYSAGRVPSDRGYEFFAEYTLRHTDPSPPPPELRDSLERRAWGELLEELSNELGLLSAATRIAAHETYKTGLEALIDHFDWQSRAEIKTVIHDFEALDERIEEAQAELIPHNDVQIFIGRKSPITRSQFLSVVTSDYEIDGERIILMAIGPKRMDYQKTTKVFKNLKKNTKNK